MSVHLREQADPIHWPETHYLFVEATGPFAQTAPRAWQEAHQRQATIAAQAQVKGAMSLYRIAEQIYRAGFILGAEPGEVPEGCRYELFPGGRYLRFTLTGPYAQLPEASQRVQQILRERPIDVRDGFYIEHYRNDPRTTPEAELITEILVPVS